MRQVTGVTCANIDLVVELAVTAPRVNLGRTQARKWTAVIPIIIMITTSSFPFPFPFHIK